MLGVHTVYISTACSYGCRSRHKLNTRLLRCHQCLVAFGSDRKNMSMRTAISQVNWLVCPFPVEEDCGAKWFSSQHQHRSCMELSRNHKQLRTWRSFSRNRHAGEPSIPLLPMIPIEWGMPQWLQVGNSCKSMNFQTIVSRALTINHLATTINIQTSSTIINHH